MIRGKWDRRIQRATELISVYPFAAEGLRFYVQAATFQKNLYSEIQKALADSPKISADRPLRDELDLFLLLPHFSPFLSLIQGIAPVPLAEAAVALALEGPPAWQRAIATFWQEPDLPGVMGEAEQADVGASHGVMSADPMLAWMFLQPYAEYLADNREPGILDGTPLTCPLCGREKIADLYALRSRMDFSKNILSRVRRRERAADGVLFGAGNRACARRCLRHVPYLPEEYRPDEDGPRGTRR
jgi:hypothetical protein